MEQSMKMISGNHFQKNMFVCLLCTVFQMNRPNGMHNKTQYRIQSFVAITYPIVKLFISAHYFFWSIQYDFAIDCINFVSFFVPIFSTRDPLCSHKPFVCWSFTIIVFFIPPPVVSVYLLFYSVIKAFVYTFYSSHFTFTLRSSEVFSLAPVLNSLSHPYTVPYTVSCKVIRCAVVHTVILCVSPSFRIFFSSFFRFPLIRSQHLLIFRILFFLFGSSYALSHSLYSFKL